MATRLVMNKESAQISTYAGVGSKIALFFTIYSVTIGFLILYFRHWDSGISKQVLGVLAYPALLFGATAIAIHRLEKNVWVIPSALLVFMLLPFCVALTGAWILFPLGLLGICLIAWSCWLAKGFYSLCEFIQLLVISIVLAVLYFFVINGSGYAHIFADLAVLKGELTRDTLFHSAIINMLARFGVPSTGLDGIPQIVYHIGVHRWVASNFLVLGGNTSVLLAISNQVAFLPVMFFSFILVVSFFVSRPAFTTTILTFSFGVILMVASRLWDGYLLSESYAFSLAIFIGMLPVGRSWLERSFKNRLLDAIRPWEIGFAIVVIAVCWSVKMSTGLILAVYLLACVLAPQFLHYSRRMAILILAIICLVFFIVSVGFYFYLGGASMFPIYPFHFARTFPYQFTWEVIIFVAMVFLFWFNSGKRDKEFRGPAVLVLLVIFFIGEVPGALFEIDGGSAGYFSNPALLITLIYGVAALLSTVSLQSWGRWYPFFGYLFLMLALVINLDISPAGTKNYKIRAFSFWKSIQANENKDSLLTHSALGRIQSLVVSLDLKATDKSMVVYIPPSYAAFWNGKEACGVRPLVVPAFIGLPLLNGVRSGMDDCPCKKRVFWTDYRTSSRNYELSQQDICFNAKRAGFKKVYEISASAEKMHFCN